MNEDKNKLVPTTVLTSQADAPFPFTSGSSGSPMTLTWNLRDVAYHHVQLRVVLVRVLNSNTRNHLPFKWTGLYPAMIGGGLGVPRHASWQGTPFHAGLHGATWPLHPATMHGGVQCNCPAMHGGGPNGLVLKKTFKSGSNLKYVSNLG
jgi:hypothetical protein